MLRWTGEVVARARGGDVVGEGLRLEVVFGVSYEGGAIR